jgi:ubiquinone/menaquinone biosynthesis C-methylase UbiE
MLKRKRDALQRAVSRFVHPLLAELEARLNGEIAKRLGPADGRIVANPYLTAKLDPFGRGDGDFIVPRARPVEGLPVPPQDLWEGYASTAEEYLAGARSDMAAMLGILREAGVPPESLSRVLDLGCAAGRMLRFFPSVPGESEHWGVDINARHIAWCQQHLGEPMLFATTTTAPHLPFEDNYFDLVYCGSVFTHISDLADAWFLELRRVLRRGGYAYITIHDKHTIDVLFTKFNDHPLFVDFVAYVRRFCERTAVREQDYVSFSIGADPYSQVFYDADSLVAKWSRLATVVSVTPEAHDHQTALLLRKRH